MSSRFTPCPACARHVKQGERACPFCGAEDPCANAPPTGGFAVALSRSALFALSAIGASVAGTDCSASSIAPYGQPPSVGDATFAEDAPVAADGGSVSGDAAREAAPLEGGSLQPVYGAPVSPTDASQKK
jgi:hypothetical protein